MKHWSHASGLFPRAFTLIEMLAVLVVFGLVVAVGLAGLGRASVAHTRLQAISTTQEMFERTRLLADGRGGAVLTLGHQLRSAPTDHNVVPTSIARELPDGWNASLVSPDVGDGGDGRVYFAVDGSCEDCVIVLTGPNGPQVSMRVLGLTGQLIVEDATTGASR